MQACFTILVCFNYSTGFSNDDFSSFTNSTKEGRLLRNEILSSKLRLIVQMFQAGAVKVKHDLLLVVLQVNQSKI